MFILQNFKQAAKHTSNSQQAASTQDWAGDFVIQYL
jgi:hypothetical protein